MTSRYFTVFSSIIKKFNKSDIFCRIKAQLNSPPPPLKENKTINKNQNKTFLRRRSGISLLMRFFLLT